ncbi:MAG: ROK family protein [Gemmatimonadaceae bacterium]
MPVIGLDLGGTKLAGALFDASGEIIGEEIVAVERREGAAVGALIVGCLERLRARGGPVKAIGISVPGISRTASGRVWAPNIPGWDDYPLRDEILAALAPKHCPVVIEADRSCCIMGEVWRGAAQECRNAIFLAVGTGIGAGILVDGRILHGAHDIAGAIGWMALHHPFAEKYGSCGHFEYYASGEGIVRAAREALAGSADYRGALRGIDPAALTAQDVFALHDTGDAVAVAALTQAVELWGMATANLVSLFNPERIIFGGGVFGPAAGLLDDIAREARRWAQPISMTQVELVASSLGGAAGLYGAGYFARLAVRHPDP